MLNLWPGFEDGDTLEATEYTIDAVAHDGNEDEQESGIATLQLFIDGEPIGESSTDCEAAPCVMSAVAEIEASDYAPGGHVISATATDASGNEASSRVRVTLEPAPVQEDIELTTSAATPGVVGPTPASHFGASIANVGDVNGDGIDDLLYGAPGALTTGTIPGGVPGVGGAYLVYGGRGTTSAVGLGDRGVVLRNALPGLATGASVAAAGDVNGDGHPDMLIGSPSVGGLGLGRVYVVYGGDLPQFIDLNSLGARGYVIKEPGAAAGTPGLTGPRFGLGLVGPAAGAGGADGDVDGDGLAEVAVGAPMLTSAGRTQAGAVFVIRGAAQRTGTVDLAGAVPGYRIDGAAANHRFGTTAGVVGDLDADGFAEIAGGAPGANAPGRADAGSIYTVRGRATPGNIDLAAAGSDAASVITGASGDAIGTSLASLGDANGDQTDDLALGGHNASMILGGSEDGGPLDLATADIAVRRFDAPTGTGYTSGRVAGADLNADGAGDLVVSYPDAAGGNGEAFAVLSATSVTTLPSGSLADAAVRMIGGDAGKRLGAGIAAVNTDGRPFIALGAPGQNSLTESGAGRVYTQSLPSATGLAAADAEDDSVRCWGETVSQRGQPHPWPRTVDQARRCRLSARRVEDRTPALLQCVDPQPNGRCKATRPTLYQQRVSDERGYETQRGRTRIRDWTLAGGKVSVYDSFGQVIAKVKQTGVQAYEVYTETDQLIGRVVPETYEYIQLDGRPCATGDAPTTRALIALETKSGDPATGKSVRFRGLIDRDKIKTDLVKRVPDDRRFHEVLAKAKTRSTPAARNNYMIDQAWSPCEVPQELKGKTPYSDWSATETQKVPDYGAPAAFRKPEDPLNPPPVRPGSGPQETYGGDTYQKTHPNDACGKFEGFEGVDEAGLEPFCGTPYLNYQLNRNTGATFPPTVYLNSSTTDVEQGAISRIIWKAPGPVPNGVIDRMSYSDRNVPCFHAYSAHWYLLKVQGLVGWYPAFDDRGHRTRDATGAFTPPAEDTYRNSAACRAHRDEYPTPPTVVTGPASDATDDSLTLSGVLSANVRAACDPETKYFFEYGTSAAFGQRTPEVEECANGEKTVTATVSGLNPGTKYYYRLAATRPPRKRYNHIPDQTDPAAIGTFVGAQKDASTTGTPILPPLARIQGEEDDQMVGYIDGHGLPTTYHWEIDTYFPYVSLTETLPAGSGEIAVTHTNCVFFQSWPETWTLVATNAAGTTTSAPFPYVEPCYLTRPAP